MPDYRLTPNTDENQIARTLNEIAIELAYNYFSNSFANNYNTEIANCDRIFHQPDDDTYGPSFRERWKNNERVRNIIIVGAGAIHDAYKPVPLGADMLSAIKEIFEKEIELMPLLEKRFKQEAQEIADITGKPDLSFENYLYIVNQFLTQDDMREKIRDLVDFRHVNSLFNEIVAHLFKHSFVDVVVNFNFEESLDQAILEEVGQDNYLNVISDGDCVPINDLVVGGRLQIPVYIKPHGTFSHKSSLRFTNKHYFDLPSDIKRLLRDLFGGTCGPGPERMRVNVIMVGFAMESIEFNHILNDVLPYNSVIYHIDFKPCADGDAFFAREPKMLERFERDALSYREKRNEIYKSVSTAGFNQQTDDPVNTLTPSLGEVFSVLWRIQNNFFKTGYKPRSIARHEITSYLLYHPEYGKKALKLEMEQARRTAIHQNIESSPAYFQDKIMLELLILLNRNGGILDIAELLKGRVGFYFSQLRGDPTRQQKLTIYEILKGYSKKDITDEARLIIASEEYKRGANIFTLVSEFDEDQLDKKGFKKILSALVKELSKMFRELPPTGDLTRKELNSTSAQFLDFFEKTVLNWFDHVTGNKELLYAQGIVRLSRAVTLLYRLLKSELTSPDFKVNLITNYHKQVFNGKHYPASKAQQHLLDEIFRLLEKSWSHHYYVIDPKASAPTHNLWESFTRERVIHTNLSRAAEFDHLLLEKDWNVFLSVTETGSFLNPLRYLNNSPNDNKQRVLKEKIKKCHFIIVCSYESIRQLYPANYTKAELIEAHAAHLRIPSASGTSTLIPTENLTLLMVPFNQHNRHSSIFLQRLPQETGNYSSLKDRSTIISGASYTGKETSNTFFFNALGSVYFFRNGLSVHINPIFIGLAEGASTGRNDNSLVFRDQIKLLDIFVRHINRAFKFEMTKRGEDPSLWPKAHWLTTLQKKWETPQNSAEQYQDITPEHFLQVLYQQLDL